MISGIWRWKLEASKLQNVISEVGRPKFKAVQNEESCKREFLSHMTRQRMWNWQWVQLMWVGLSSKV